MNPLVLLRVLALAKSGQDTLSAWLSPPSLLLALSCSLTEQCVIRVANTQTRRITHLQTHLGVHTCCDSAASLWESPGRLEESWIAALGS